MLPSCSFEAASSEGSKTKVVLSLLMLRMDLMNAGLLHLHHFVGEGGLKNVPWLGGQIGRQVEGTHRAGPGSSFLG